MNAKFLAVGAFAALMFMPAANAATVEEMRATSLARCQTDMAGNPEGTGLCDCIIGEIDKTFAGDDLSRVYTLMSADPQPTNDAEAAAVVGLDEATFTTWSATIEPGFATAATTCMPQPVPAPEPAPTPAPQ